LSGVALAGVQAYERMNVADALQTKYYEDGDAIINQVSIPGGPQKWHSFFVCLNFIKY